MISLTTLTTWQYPRKGTEHIVVNPSLTEPLELRGQEILLNGTVVTVTDVETFWTERPYPPDENIGIFVVQECEHPAVFSQDSNPPILTCTVCHARLPS